MTDLMPLLAAPGAHTMIYTDPAFPQQPLLLHSARPRRFDEHTPVLIVHHGVARNGRDYRDYWLRVVDDAGILAIAIEFTEQAFPDYLWYHFGNRHDEKGAPNPREHRSGRLHRPPPRPPTPTARQSPRSDALPRTLLTLAEW